MGRSDSRPGDKRELPERKGRRNGFRHRSGDDIQGGGSRPGAPTSLPLIHQAYAERDKHLEIAKAAEGAGSDMSPA